jgi:transcriptional regulator with XRE-family HTH domain
MSELVGPNVKAARIRKSLSQEELAAKASLSVSYISMLERGQRVPPLDTLEVLARALEGSRPPRLPLLDQGHLQFFRRDHLLRLFAECGFEVESLRSIGVRRGLRALGWLPRKRRWMNSAEAGHTRGGVSGAGRPGDSRRPVDTADGAGFEPLYSQVCREIDGRHQGWRSWPAYFHLRELARRLDTLPGSAPFGFDFEIWLVRR